MIDRLNTWIWSSYALDTSSIGPVTTELTRRRAVDLLRVATALCPAS